MGTLIVAKRKIRKNTTKRVAIEKTKHGYQKVKGAIKSVFAGNPEKRHQKKKKRALIKSIRKGY